MSLTATILTVIAVVGAIGVSVYLWWGFSRMGAPFLPPGGPAGDALPPRPPQDDAPVEDEPGPSRAGGFPRPDLSDAEVAAADALVRRWFLGRLGGPRGLDKATREERLRQLVDEQGLTPGLAAATLYDRHCRERRQTAKHPPAEVRKALVRLGVKR